VATATQALDSAAAAGLSWAQLLCAELAPTPDRLNATVRIVVATTIVLVTSMTLEVPSVAMSLLVVLLLTKQSSVLTAIAGILGIVMVTLAIALTILLLRFTIDYPLLRLATMALALFAGMYASRVFALGPAGFLIALVVLLSEADVDLAPGQGEEILRAVLWVWVAVVYPAAVTIAVNLLLLPADPAPILGREVAARLRVVARVLRARPTSDEARTAAAALAAFATTGPAPLLKLLRFAEIRESALQSLRAERTAKILLLERLVELAALLPDLAIEPSPDQRARLERVAAACESFAASVIADVRLAPLPPFPNLPEDAASSALTPVLAELERLVYELPLADRPAVDQPASGRRLFVPDAFTNPRYTRFALKVTLAAMFCYIAYTAVDWNGISTSMNTCAVVALGSAVASIHKATLRIVGCALGGAAALASIVFLIPHMTTIVPLALLVAAVTVPAAWIALGSERTAYMGVQIAFAFYLAALHGYAPSTDVNEFRDRIVGVVLGVIVMAVVFSYVWPERAGTGMARSLAEALRRMAQIGIGRGAVSPGARALRAAAWHALDEASRMSDLYAFEPEALSASRAATGARARELIDLTRRTLLAQSALIEQRETDDLTTTDPVVDEARAALNRAIADALERVANRVETGASADPSDVRAPLEALKVQRPSTREAAGLFDGEIALCDVLVDRVEALQRGAESA
jgi:multidrug resistance protein MdtO